MRYENDAVVTWKATDTLTLVTEANWIRDDFDGYLHQGQAELRRTRSAWRSTVVYTLCDTVTFNARAEVYRDDNGFFVAAFPNNSDMATTTSSVANWSSRRGFGLAPAELGPPMARSPSA